MKIITQYIYRQQGNPGQIKKLESKLSQTQADLHSILNEWKWGDQPIQSAEDFLSKMKPWVKTRNEELTEQKAFFKKFKVNSFKDIAGVKIKGG
jgi:hypothetical protein